MSEPEEDDDFAVFGTPLEPIDEDALPRKKPFALEDQVVRDKQGRRRFHGAFTGGFSAGFFNSVGSLEGWQPAAFKSSRGSGKADKVSQRPEDFMDDEDIEEHGIAPQVLRATSDFSEQRGTKRPRPEQSDGPIPGKPVLGELLKPANETVGIKLLKRMGWKPGQGVGPRLTRTEKKRTNREHRKSAVKVYGCSLPDFTDPATNEEDDVSSSDEDDVDVTFAPDDYEPFLCKPKDNCFGIGYVGLDKRPVLSAHINLFEPSSLQMTDKNKKKVNITGQAFGVGAFEEEDSDIYARDDMSQYDFALESTSKSKLKRKQRWSDGKESQNLVKCLEGFHLTSQTAVRKKHFPPPTLPRDYKPVHVVRKSRFAAAPVPVEDNHSKKRGLERHALTADDRSHIIGESVSLPTIIEAAPVVPTTPQSATDVLGRFRPFVAHPEKQQRYEKFLALKKDEQKEGLTRLQPLSMLEWEREHERMEFEQAERLYRPMSGIMNDRFVSAKQDDETTNPLAAVERSRLDVDKDVIEAAKMKMFGRLTRERSEWRPTSLLCKRFNIPEPFGGSSTTPSSGPQKRTSKFSVFDYLDSAKHNSTAVGKEEPMESDTEDVISEPQPIKLEIRMEEAAASTEPAQTSTETLQFPDLPEKVDLFKAIFLSSDEDSASEEEVVIPPESANIQRNTSPPRGIFANLDLDAINSYREVEEIEVEKVEVIAPPPEVVVQVRDPSPETYGPVLPPSFQPRPHSPSGSDSSEDRKKEGKWVEKTAHRKARKHKDKKGHKKSSKHKKHKSHKKKHKKK